MSKPVRYARVAIESPLPQLDRLFDYAIPESMLADCQPGVRVSVPFGKGGAALNGFVIELSDTTDFDGEANSIASVISPAPVLPAKTYRLLRAIADRQAGSLAELTKLAIPTRSVRVEKAWLAARAMGSELADGSNAAAISSLDFAGRPATYSGKNTLLAEPRTIAANYADSALNLQGWICHLVAFALEQLATGRQALLVVPDFRDQNRLKAAFSQIGMEALVIDFATDQTNSARYVSFLRCLTSQPAVVIGSRTSIYAPLENLGGIAIWDDSDSSLQEPTAPYLHSREVALLRQQQTGCNLLISGHSRSPEVQRLIEISYLTDLTASFAPPRIAVTEPGLRVDSTSYQLARETFEAGGAVLVQVANTGHSNGTYCQDCGERSRCRTCNGPIFIDGKQTPRCRWCSAINLGLACHSCNSSKIRQGLAGSSRTAAELGKAFPGVAVVEATWQHRIESLKPGKRLVVATPGAEPVVEGGYQAVIILDGQKLASRDTLRASEIAVNLWSNAVSLLAPGGRCVGVGLATPLGKKFALWDQRGLAADELANRRELGFPPHLRMASVSGPKDLVDQIVSELPAAIGKPGAVEILGPLLQNEHQPNGKNPALAAETWRYLIRYEYAVGEAMAKELKARAMIANAGNRSVSAKSGRVSRAVRVRMDDSEVI
jgi:primosomal protein N' (replication factor Y)